MALTVTYETFVKKQASIEKKKLEIDDLISQKNTDVGALQAQINTTIANYDTQITAKRSEIAVLESDIKKLAIT